MLYCGASELEITPSLGSSIPGYFHDRKSSGVLDPLFVKALVVESSGTAVAMVVLDTILVTRALVEQIRDRVTTFTGLPPSQVMISATHTHTGPPVSTTVVMQADEAYMDWLARKSADAVLLAYNNIKEACIGVGAGHEADIAFNRRFFMKDGTVVTNPGIGNPDVDRPTGPIDPQVTVIRIDDLHGNALAVVTNYALHTDTVGGTQYCADYPGELSAVLKKAMGAHVVSLFMMGASGNINHHNVLGIRKEEYVRDPLLYLKIGRILAGEVLKTREKIKTSPNLQLQTASASVTLQYRQPTAAQVQAAEEAVIRLPEHHLERAFAEELLKANESGDGSVEAEIQAIRLGDFSVIGLPAELFVELGLEIKTGSPFKHTLINELCNGIPGTYVCTREAYDQGGYEPRITWGNRLQVEAGEIIVEQSLKLLRELAGC